MRQEKAKLEREKSLKDLNIDHVKKVATSSSVKAAISPPFLNATVSTKPILHLKTAISSPRENVNHHIGFRGVETSSASSSFNSIQTIKYEADVREEVLKQEARLKIVAAEQDAQVKIAYVKTEEAAQKAEQDLFRVQSLFNDEKEGIL